MKIKNFQEKQKVSPENKIMRAQLQALLITDGSVIPQGNQISFANTSKELIKKFCDLIYVVYEYRVPRSRIGFGKGTKQILYIVQFRSKHICEDLISDMNYNTTKYATIPKYWFEFRNNEISGIIRNLFDADDGCSLRVAWLKRKKCFEIKKSIFLACKNPNLRKEYRKLLRKINITTGESSDKITITSKEMIQKFLDIVDFSKNVMIGYDSNHWQGMEKRYLLRRIIESYPIPRGQIQKFKTNKEIYDLLA